MNVIDSRNWDLKTVFHDQVVRNKFHRAGDYSDVMENILSGKLSGIPFVLAPGLRFRAGEVTLWGGISGHGKSLITGQVAMQLVLAKQKIGIASFEMSTAMTLCRMARQFYGEKTPKAVIPFLKTFGRTVTLFDHRGAITPEEVLGAVKVFASDFGCSHIFIDNLMKVVSGEDDYNGQKVFVQWLCDMAIDLNVHIHVIHHVRKGETEDTPVNGFSFRGSSSIRDQVDNAIIIQRNRKKERDMQALLDAGADTRHLDSDPDVFLRVVKQRNGDWEGERGLYFNRRATSYCLDARRITAWQ